MTLLVGGGAGEGGPSYHPSWLDIAGMIWDAGHQAFIAPGVAFGQWAGGTTMDVGTGFYQLAAAAKEAADIAAAAVLAPLNGGNGNGGASAVSKNRFLPYMLGGMAAVALAPSLYRAANASSRGKRGKRHEEIAQSLEASSSRATSIITAFAPIVAVPATYIAIDELENRQIISGPLGNDVQALMTTMVAGQLIGGLLGMVTKAV